MTRPILLHLADDDEIQFHTADLETALELLAAGYVVADEDQGAELAKEALRLMESEK